MNKKQADARRKTLEVLNGQRPRCSDGRNWLGRALKRAGKTNGAAQVDLLLLDGATREEMQQHRKTPASLETHLNRLRKWFGLPIWQDQDGRLRFDKLVLETF